MSRVSAPIIIVGAGRSGSSLLNAMLGSHPKIAMLGEFDSTVPKLWDCFWNTSAAGNARTKFNRDGIRRAHPSGLLSDEAEFEAVSAAERVERERIGKIIRTAIHDTYRLHDEPGRGWGFKEIWVGSDGLRDWEIYDQVFPEAFFVHIVRNPFEFARSCADWNRVPLTSAFLRERLAQWVDCFRASKSRARTGRYAFLKYETLVSDPMATTGAVLSRLGLDWDAACLAPLAQKHVASVRKSPLPADAAETAALVPQLRELMGELGYAVPADEHHSCEGMDEHPIEGATNLADGLWRLNPPFIADGKYGWIVSLNLVSELASLVDVADDLNAPQRSPLQLFEGEKPLGPPHSLHVRIREQGFGRYSHWAVGHALLFSTSDNSNPNHNGRTYTVSIKRSS